MPGPDVQARNQRVARRLLCRRELEAEPVADEEVGDDTVSRFLAMWNGDWASSTIIHICNGCCAGPAEAQASFFATLIEVGIFGSRETDMPKMDDLLTCGA